MIAAMLRAEIELNNNDIATDSDKIEKNSYEREFFEIISRMR